MGPHDANPALGPDGQPLPVEVLDWAAALKRVDGDRELLRTFVTLYLRECPRWLAELRQAVARQDGRLLRRMAHTIKGALGQLGAQSAAAAALRLETMGQEGVFAGADEACARLENELQRLQPALDRFAAPGAG
jgi:HPt (histidine-containing phosphotransfer) domain-containing protein